MDRTQYVCDPEGPGREGLVGISYRDRAADFPRLRQMFSALGLAIIQPPPVVRSDLGACGVPCRQLRLAFDRILAFGFLVF